MDTLKKKPNKQKKRFFSYIGPCDNILLVFEIFVPTNLAIDKRVNNMHYEKKNKQKKTKKRGQE